MRGLSQLRACRETASLKLAKLRGCTFVNQYVVIKYLGRGACGRVFLCMDMTDNRLYAVKVPPTRSVHGVCLSTHTLGGASLLLPEPIAAGSMPGGSACARLCVL